MRARSWLAVAALVLALGVVAPAEAASPKPWEFFKQLIHRPPFKSEKPARAPTPKEDVAAAPAETAVPLPRPRPHREGDKRRMHDFDAAFVPPPVLKLPADTEPAAVETAASTEPAAEPDAPPQELIPLGPPGKESRAAATVPFPIPRPRHQTADIEPLAMLPADPAPAATRRRARPEIAGCVASLAALGVEAQPLAPVSEGACGIAAPASIVSLENGAVKLPIKALVNCRMAETAAHWLSNTVQPAATDALGGRVTGLRIAASYDCRTRDHIPGAKLSEHAFGNAIDFSAFRVKDRWIEVGGAHDTAETTFLSRIRSEACGPFRTVLGPGTDSYHADHLHLDLAERRTAGPSKGLYCK